MIQPFQIYQAAYDWNGCRDPRPWLVIEMRSNDVLGCFPIASECYGGSCFPLSTSHPDFAATGLSKNCHIHDSHIYELPQSAIIRYRGELRGVLLREFRGFSGV